jgi:hypothetical protein
MIEAFTKLWLTIFITNNWQQIASTVIALFIIYAFIKFNTSFDDNQQISPQEMLKTAMFLLVLLPILALVGNLMYSYYG